MNKNPIQVVIDNREFTVVDLINNITIADSFVYRHNKTMSGNGEAKLYLGYENDMLKEFWDFDKDFLNCFIVKKDLKKFLADTKEEYLNPRQIYTISRDRRVLFQNLNSKLDEFNDNILKFQAFKTETAPPRLYLNSESVYYKFIREISLPNLTTLSIMKLRNSDNDVYYYFKLFTSINYSEPENGHEMEICEERQKSYSLVESRKGHAKYRQELLKECNFCPFTLIDDERLLIASHIKPWAHSNIQEKTDPKNGFVFTASYDLLFDKGFITFDNDKRIIVSVWLSEHNQNILNIYTGKKIQHLPLDRERKEFLNYHRENIFIDANL